MNSTRNSPLEGFQGKIRSSPVSLFYSLGLLFVTAAMALLPLIYLMVIAAVGWVTYWHATHNYGIITSSGVHGRGIIVLFLIYITPIFAGAVMLFFMIKPLFARRPEAAQPYALNPENEPLLHEFIHKICKLVGAPPPRRIDLDCNINAAASLRNGWKSLFSDDLVLTIGIPLVAGLNMRQFAGVIAHEFGHFTQGFGMRLSYIARSISAWFARVVYERDQWDVTLEEWGQAEDARVAIVVAMAKLGVWFSRRILQVLMLIGHGISCFMLRQMEYDADYYEIQLAGSEPFEQTVERLHTLGMLAEIGYKEMRTSWNINRRLPDSVPAYLLTKELEHGENIRGKLKKTLPNSQTKLFDTHPSDADRVRCARLANSPGIFHIERPAAELFSNFPAVSRIVTMIHYQDDLAIPVVTANLVATDESCFRVSSASASEPKEEPKLVVDRFFNGIVNNIRPIKLEHAAIADLSSALQAADILAQQIQDVLPQVQSAIERFEAEDSACTSSYQALLLLKSGFSIDPQQFGLNCEPHAAALDAFFQEMRLNREVTLDKMRAVFQALSRRFSLAAALVQSSEAAPLLDQPTAFENRTALQIIQALQGCWADVLSLRMETSGLSALVHNMGAQNSPMLLFIYNETVQRCVDLIQRIAPALELAELAQDADLSMILGQVSPLAEPQQFWSASCQLVETIFARNSAAIAQIILAYEMVSAQSTQARRQPA
jgi:Zn-dependent protease with chaperone function